ncbi:hypothetical protein CA13_45000 [Planctomycetes bacterium CA13]|uniref:Dockerin type I repeat protein n=1 Tax=Novipirellula herctigrandis TaxID=2527986 RepID=A0A5C5Z7H4_9BACT|nr:hypothetical protein CA13_45000 [Planctomycetes bacterium CA13]
MNTKKRRSFATSLRRRLTTEILEDRRLLAAGPYAPAAGEIGSTAISMDDAAIIGWATNWKDYAPGAEVDAQWQTPHKAIGPAEGNTGDVVTLGRGGQITLEFDAPIRDGLGNDFAVFENALTDSFLELGYVEVSSDGVHFFRFANDSQTDAAVGTYESLDPTQINGLAGKYRQGFGTPFDLASLKGTSPFLDVTSVTHVRVIDIVGDGSAKDTSNDSIFDPYPTNGSAGFDLDGVAVMNQSPVTISSIDFEDVGATLGANSHWNGPDPNGTTITGAYDELTTVGQFQTAGATFNNAISLDSGAWNGWAYSNETNTTTPGFENSFSAFPGQGATGSGTFAVAFADQSDFYEPPTITLPVGAGMVQSIQVTNTTYAALSMRDGDSFAEPFGGASGNEPDWFLLTIEGKDPGGASVGTVDFYLADYRFADSASDYIVDTWQTIDLSSLGQAASLQFALTSSDVGTFGMNTPAFFAVDNLQLVEPGLAIDFLKYAVTEDAGSQATTARVTRGGTSLASAQVVQLQPNNASLSVPASVSIPAGQAFVDFSIGVIDNQVSLGDVMVELTASTTSGLQATRTLQVVEDDLPPLTFSVNPSTVDEGDTVTATVTRPDANKATALTVNLSSDLPAIASLPETVIIPAGATSVMFDITGVDDEIDHGQSTVPLTASANGFVSATSQVVVSDNDIAALAITSNPSEFSESDAFPTTQFEDVGSRLSEESFNNGSDGRGGFTSNSLNFNNDYNSEYGSWSGWAFSNTTDTTTPGYFNQYSAFAAGGANGSDTYAVASVYGIDLPNIVRDESNGIGFKELSVTNTTYAALSMREGDAFAKKFGGESGDDADWLLLTIQGLNNQDESVGTVDFYLADYRFDDNSLDYIVSDWTTVDVSSLTAATKLVFSLSSSDNGDFGMNTPAYFAIDNVVLDQSSGSNSPSILVTREKMELTDPIEVTLTSSDPGLALVPQTVTIPTGQASIEVPVRLLDNSTSDENRLVTFSAAANRLSATADVVITDDDAPAVTLTIQTPQLNETQGSPRADFERIGQQLTNETAYNGSDGAGQFESSALIFNNDFNPTWGSWSGWAVSNTTDSTTPGYGNQFSSITSSGANDSATFAIGTTGGVTPTIERSDDADNFVFDSLQVTNATYSALSMLDGDFFAKKFGGESGDDADWFLLTIEGYDASNESIGEIEFYLADYRFSDNSLDYVVDAWTKIDLSSIGEARSLSFSLSSSDVGDFGMNTPAYFAVDDIQMKSTDTSVGSGIVRRNDADISTPLTVTLSSAPAGPLLLPPSVTIPSGSKTASFSFDIANNSLVNDAVITIDGTADGYTSFGDSVRIVDNDYSPVGFIVAQSSGTTAVSESGTSDFVEVRLTSKPDSDVVIEVSHQSSDDFSVNVTRLTFTTENWNSAQTVSFSGIPDFEVEENDLGTVRIQVVATDSDPAFADAETTDVVVAIGEHAITDIELIASEGKPIIRDAALGFEFSFSESNERSQWTADDRVQNLTVMENTFDTGLAEVNLAGGTDSVELSDSTSLHLDGGDGIDRLTILATDRELNLGGFLTDAVVGFEHIIVAREGSSSIYIGSDTSLVSLGSEVTTVVHAKSRPVFVDPAWELRDPRIVDGVFMHIISQGETEIHIESTSSWQNVRDHYDVNNNGSVASSDALAIINQLLMQATPNLPSIDTLETFGGFYFDVTGEGELTALDALVVINLLNQTVELPAGNGEQVVSVIFASTSSEPNLGDLLDDQVPFDLSPLSTSPTKSNATDSLNPTREVVFVEPVDAVMREIDDVISEIGEIKIGNEL